MRHKKVNLTETQFKKALRLLVRLLIKAIQGGEPISLSHLPESIKTVRGRNLSTAGDGVRCLNRILVDQQEVLIPTGRGRYAWKDRKKMGRTIKESVDNLYNWIRNYESPTRVQKADNSVITEATTALQVMNNHVLIMPNERAVLRQLLRDKSNTNADAITQLAIERLLDVLDENKVVRKQKLLTNG